MGTSESGKNTFLSFLVSKRFLINLSIAMLVFVVIFLLLIKFLDIYTRHGKEVKLPDFYGLTMAQVDSTGFTDQFDFFITDSLYDDNQPKGVIIIQDPLPGSWVKKGRNVYVSIVATLPEMVVMPDLKDLTLRQAINILESSKLKAGKLIYEPSFDKNAILEQMWNGDTIWPGDTLVKGSVVDLIVGSGDRQYKIPIPFLIGKTREEAIYDLNIASFNLGSEFYMDSIMGETVRVYMQEPMWDTEIPYFPGDSVHLWYRSVDSVDFDIYVRTFLPDSLQVDSLNLDL
jgi:beta-lactam-binding protein with PASTA domain